MERTMTVEEKIRRAEEIYNRRNQNQYIYSSTRPKEKKSQSLTQRMIKQIIICFLIYGIFYVVTNREYYLSQEFQAKVEQVASQNETTKQAYNWLKENIQKYLIKQNEPKNQENKTKNENSKNIENTENAENVENTSTEEQKDAQESRKENETEDIKTANEEHIGGAEEGIKETEKTQEEKDIEKIKKTTSFIKPIEGTISSTFGWRTPTTATVPKYHTGLDIAAKTGTKIKAATGGKVILKSSQGDYGKHYKIQIDDIVIIYAHCDKLYLNEGDDVYQGQEIAEVGSTGNSTRSTFAF